MAKMDKAMGHSHSNSVLLAPKETGDLIWKFDNAMNIEIACNVPGHYEIGMIVSAIRLIISIINQINELRNNKL